MLSTLANVRVWKNVTGSAIGWRGNVMKFGLKGSADILGLVGPSGRLLALEIKTGRARQRKEQRAFEAMVTRLGGLYLIIRDEKDVAALYDFLSPK